MNGRSRETASKSEGNRRTKGVQHRKLERLADLSYLTVRDIFRDPYKEVITTALTKLAIALGVPVSDLFEEVPDERTD